LNSGLIDDALVDMTGLVAEKMKVSDFTGERRQELWNKLTMFRKNKSLMGCSIEGGTEGEVRWEGERTGLLSGHAYSLVDILNFTHQSSENGKYNLLRLRNPWGRLEWSGPWANGSDELEDYGSDLSSEVNKLGADERFDIHDRNDGTFLMEMRDWGEIYHNLYACVDFPDNWFGVRFNSAWTAANSGGVPRS
jgi:calpain